MSETPVILSTYLYQYPCGHIRNSRIQPAGPCELCALRQRLEAAERERDDYARCSKENADAWIREKSDCAARLHERSAEISAVEEERDSLPAELAAVRAEFESFRQNCAHASKLDVEAAVEPLRAENARLREALLGGVGLIATERQRQVSAEGWTPEHDDEHTMAEMTTAAVTYALWASEQVTVPELKAVAWQYWPWDRVWWKPSEEPIRNLTKAGALIAAEIDRLQRAALAASEAGRG